MTIAVTRKHSMQNERQQRFRDLDRSLAKRYVQEILLRRREERRSRIISNQDSDNPPPIKPEFWQPRMEVCDDPQSSRISATLELPGLKETDLNVERHGDRLIVSGERRSPIPSDSTLAVAKYPVQEFKYGKYRRVIDLPPGTQRSTVSCLLRDGLFVVTWPRTPVVSVIERNRVESRRSAPEE